MSTFEAIRSVTGWVRPIGNHGCKAAQIIPVIHASVPSALCELCMRGVLMSVLLYLHADFCLLGVAGPVDSALSRR